MMSRFIRAATSLAALVPLVVLGASPSTGAATAAAVDTTLRIGTWNVEVGRPVADFRAGVLPLMDRSDLVALQEMDTPDKEDVLRSAATSGWSYFRQRPGLQTPVLWRTDRFTFVSARIPTISTARWIGRECSELKPSQPARTATIVRLVDNVTGGRVSVINTHLVSGAVRGGRPWVGRPKLFRLYRDGLVNTMRLVQAERTWGRVFVVGDFNSGWVADRKHLLPKLPVRSMAALGMQSMWATTRPANGLGTRGIALLDQTFSTLRATNAAVQFDLAGHSDHRPAIAYYAHS